MDVFHPNKKHNEFIASGDFFALFSLIAILAGPGTGPGRRWIVIEWGGNRVKKDVRKVSINLDASVLGGYYWSLSEGRRR